MEELLKCQDDSCELGHCARCGCHTISNQFIGGCCFDCFDMEFPILNRLQKREKAVGSWIAETEIPNVCMLLRMSVSGAMDWLGFETEEKYVKYLQTCLDTWESSICERYAVFDEAVRQLIIATLREYNEQRDLNVN